MAKPASGMYKTKARNLTDAQLKRAKGLKASGKRTVDIGVTQRIKEGALKGKTVGAGGKPLTGTVIMPNGDRAVYKAGKRVTNVPKKSLAPKGGNGGGGGGGGGDDKGKTLTGNKRTNRLAGARYEAMKGMKRGVTGNRSATSATVSSAMSASAAKDKKMTPAQRAGRATSGYVRGSVGSTSVAQNMSKGMTRSEAMRSKRLEDTRNKGRNALGIAGLAAAPYLAAGGAKLGGAALAARLGTAAMQQGASQGLQSGARYAAGQGAARGSMAAAKAAAKPKRPVVTNKDIGATARGISKRTGGVLKNGKPSTYGPRKPTAAQLATQRRQMAAKKAAATRRANAAAAAKKRKK